MKEQYRNTVLADKIRSNIFQAVFWTPGLAPVILDIAYLVALVLRIGITLLCSIIFVDFMAILVELGLFPRS